MSKKQCAIRLIAQKTQTLNNCYFKLNRFEIWQDKCFLLQNVFQKEEFKNCPPEFDVETPF